MPINRVEKSPPLIPNQKPEPQKAKELQWTVTAPQHTMDELILEASTKRQLMDVISYFKNRALLFEVWGLAERFSQMDGLAVNLYGPPGTGKTLAAHAIVAALGLQMICVNYADIESKYVGETSKNLSRLFQTAKQTGAVIFFDEADALLSKRVTNMTSATDVSVNQTRSVLLTLLNDYHGVILFATNFIQNFDAAFLRRIRYHIQFHLPDAALRQALWEMYIPKKMPHHADFAELAERFPGVSGSEIANAVFSAAVSAARDGVFSVEQRYFEQAIQHCIDVKRANAGITVSVKKRILGEEEVKQLNLEQKEEPVCSESLQPN